MGNRASTIKSPRVEVVCVGTELLTGKVNTHTAYLGPKLANIGLSIACEHAVGDDPELMREVFSGAFKRSDIVLCAGGLGPTFDDITRDVWSRVVKRPLRIQSWIVDDIRAKFERRGIAMPPMNRRQAMVLRGAEVIGNPLGTAPGQLLKIKNKIVVLLPGPSRELYPMVETTVLSRLREHFPGYVLAHHVFQIFGVPESTVDEIVRPWVARNERVLGCTITHGILASQSVISVKFTVTGKDPAVVQQVSHKLLPELRKLLGDLVFGEGDVLLDHVVGTLLQTKRKTVAVAESCTGGTLSKLLTENAGASDYFLEGVVAYSNASKMRRLGVSEQTLKKFGAVSAETAKEMAQGLRQRVKCDYTLSVTGIAGPGGGTQQKPVGLVYVACCGPRKTIVKKFRFIGERGLVRHRAALSALNMLRKEIV